VCILSRIDFETIIDVEALGRAVGPAPNFATAVQDRTPGGGALFSEAGAGSREQGAGSGTCRCIGGNRSLLPAPSYS